VSGNPLLDSLFCYDNQLTSLDVSGNPLLVYLDCDDNPLRSLDIHPAAILLYPYIPSPLYTGPFAITGGSFTFDVKAFVGASKLSNLSFASADLTAAGATYNATTGILTFSTVDPVSIAYSYNTGNVAAGALTVTLELADPSTTNDITSFVLAGVAGTITGTDIAITLPYGTAVTALTPAIVHNGASISPTGAEDFTSPVVYTVTAADSSTKAYTVTVTISANTSVPPALPQTGDTTAALTLSLAALLALGGMVLLLNAKRRKTLRPKN
jgi:LPXTG-motif cell wall-anchored protein